MKNKFALQVRNIWPRIWYEDRGVGYYPEESRGDTISEIRQMIYKEADERTLTFSKHFRIVTYDGHPVERWKVTPGKAKKLWRKK